MNGLTRRILREFQVFLDALTERELLIDSNPLVVESSESGCRITWASASTLAYLLTDYSSIEQYVEIVNRRDFSLCFTDGGLIQIGYELDEENITFHRLCYVPCPFRYESTEWEGFSLSEIPSMMSEKDLFRDTRLASTIRFDFNAAVCDDKHSYSHVSINKDTCRIPAYGPVSLGHFFRFVLRYFYEAEFDDGAWWSEVRPRLYLRTLGVPSPHELHLESAVGFD